MRHERHPGIAPEVRKYLLLLEILALNLDGPPGEAFLDTKSGDGSDQKNPENQTESDAERLTTAYDVIACHYLILWQ